MTSFSSKKINSDNLLQSLQNGFISKSFYSCQTLTPSLLVNDQKNHKNILSSIEDL